MPPANHVGAHARYLDVWTRALSAPKGIMVKTEAPKDFRGRLYHARAAERKNNARVYPEGHVLHGTSAFDHLIVRVVPGGLHILPQVDVEEITEL